MPVVERTAIKDMVFLLESRGFRKLKADLMKVYNSRAGKENLWEFVPLKICKKNYHVEVRSIHKSDIAEIDTFEELISVDPSMQTILATKVSKRNRRQRIPGVGEVTLKTYTKQSLDSSRAQHLIGA